MVFESLATRPAPSEAAQRLGTASPPASTSLTAALRLQALAASLSRTQAEVLQREAESRLDNSRDRRRAREFAREARERCGCDDEDALSDDDERSADGDSGDEEGPMDPERLLRLGIVDRNGDKIRVQARPLPRRRIGELIGR